MNCRMAVFIGVLTAGIPVSSAQAQEVRVGMHGGYGFEFDRALFGGQLRIPVSRAVDLYPSFDYHFTDDGSVLGYNADAVLRAGGTSFYMGGGLSILDPSDAGSDTGFSLFGGWESRSYGTTNPYLEFRGVFHDEASLQVVVGLNFMIQ